MAVNLQGLKDNARKTAITELQSCMNDAASLSMALKQAHWNVKGPNFIAIHELFDAVKARLDPQIDAMAERVQQLDGVAVGTVEEVAKATKLKPYPTDLGPYVLVAQHDNNNGDPSFSMFFKYASEGRQSGSPIPGSTR